jgi:hypothetical protein
MSFVTPVKAWVAQLFAGGFISHGQSLTLTVALTQGWEIQIPVEIRYGTNVSFGAAFYVYPSSDGGASFDTEPLLAFGSRTLANSSIRSTVKLTTGIYAMRVLISSPSVTVRVLTAEVLTAVDVT